MKLKIENMFPITLSLIVVMVFLWVELTPSGKNLLRDKLYDAITVLDSARYDIKEAYLLDSIKLKKNPNKIILINAQDTQYLSDSNDVSKNQKNLNEIVSKLLQGNPRLIATDMIITLPSTKLARDLNNILLNNTVNSPQNLKLLEAYDNNLKNMISTNNIILPMLQTERHVQYGTLPKSILKLDKNNYIIKNIHGYIANYKSLQCSVKYSGFINIQGASTYANNQVPLLVRNNLDVYPSLALAMAMQLFPKRQINLDTTIVGKSTWLKSIKFGEQIIPTGSKGEIYTPFNKGVFAPTQISARKLLENDFDLNIIKDGIIILNTNMDPIRTDFNILQSTFNLNAQISMLNSILSDIYLYSPYWSKLLKIYLIIAFGILITLSFILLNTGLALGISLLLSSCLVLTNTISFYYMHTVLNISAAVFLGFVLIMINMTFSWLFETHKKLYIRNFFAQYVPPAYLNLLLENPNAYGFEGKSQDLTVLFADIRNFTGISENLDASNVKKLLNKFFTPMTSVILKNGGTVDKYVGDMIMAFFGAPITNQNHRESALNCALEMLAYTKKMRKIFISENLPPIELSIGLNSGMMNVGDMGSEFRRSYTVIGNAVNIGSRIQSITSYYGVKLLAGSDTCKDQAKFVFRMLDKVKLKGKNECETIYEVVGRTKSTREYVIREIEEHQKALDAYFARNWDLAIHLFSELSRKFPDYKVYSIFLERSQNYKLHNPPEDWDGAHTFTEK